MIGSVSQVKRTRPAKAGGGSGTWETLMATVKSISQALTPSPSSCPTGEHVTQFRVVRHAFRRANTGFDACDTRQFAPTGKSQTLEQETVFAAANFISTSHDKQPIHQPLENRSFAVASPLETPRATMPARRSGRIGADEVDSIRVYAAAALRQCRRSDGDANLAG